MWVIVQPQRNRKKPRLGEVINQIKYHNALNFVCSSVPIKTNLA